MGDFKGKMGFVLIWEAMISKPLIQFSVYSCSCAPSLLFTCAQNLYARQEGTARTGYGTTDWFKIGKKNVKAVYYDSAYLTYAEYIMRNAGLDEA